MVRNFTTWNFCRASIILVIATGLSRVGATDTFCSVLIFSSVGILKVVLSLGYRLGEQARRDRWAETYFFTILLSLLLLVLRAFLLTGDPTQHKAAHLPSDG